MLTSIYFTAHKNTRKMIFLPEKQQFGAVVKASLTFMILSATTFTRLIFSISLNCLKSSPRSLLLGALGVKPPGVLGVKPTDWQASALLNLSTKFFAFCGLFCWGELEERFFDGELEKNFCEGELREFMVFRLLLRSCFGDV